MEGKGSVNNVSVYWCLRQLELGDEIRHTEFGSENQPLSAGPNVDVEVARISIREKVSSCVAAAIAVEYRPTNLRADQVLIRLAVVRGHANL